MIIINNVLETKSLNSPILYNVFMFAIKNEKVANEKVVHRMLTININKNHKLIERKSYMVNTYDPRISFIKMQIGVNYRTYEKRIGNHCIHINKKEYYKQLKEHLIHYE